MTTLKKIEQCIHGQLQTTTATTTPIGKKAATTAIAATAPANTGSSTGIILHSYVYEVSFVNANPHPMAVPEKVQTKYNNYFIGNNPAKWAGKCAVYNAVTFKNVYPGIDVHYYTTGGHLKYDIIVNPGGDVSKVALSINGAEGLQLKAGNLIVKTSVDDVKELAPYSYSASPEGNKQLQCKYNLNKNIITFKFADKIQPGTPLVIDPTLIFCSFTGSTVDNWGYTATYDGAGNFYAGGIAFDNSNGDRFPATLGAYQTTFQGGNNNTGEGEYPGNGQPNIDVTGFDIAIMKFNSIGTKVLYATYLGGSTGNEQPHSLVADADGNLIIAGRTTSTTGTGEDYPTLAPNVIGKGGGQDIVISKLSADGSSLLGSLRIGGTLDDGVNIRTKDLGTPGTISIRRNYGDDARGEVILDNAGNICLASCTQSSDFPLVNAFDNALGGTQDAVLLKFAPGLNAQPLLSTFLGGSGDDAAFVLAQNPVTGNLYVAGTTSSANLPGISGTASTPLSGAFIGGACDGFISEISGNSLIKTVYFGTTAADQIYGIDFNKAGNPFIMGTTEGAVTPINSPYDTKNATQAQGKQFITKLQPDLSGVIYSSNFGPAGRKYPNISPTAFLVDICENVYISGWGAGLDSLEPYANSGLYGLPTTVTTNTNQLSNQLKGLGNFYFFVMEKDANSQLYGAFLGNTRDYDGVHVDGGTSRFDKSGIIYQAICACGPDNTLSTNPAIPPGAAENDSTYGCNLTSIKIAFNFAGVRSAVKSSITGSTNDTTGCVPLAINFTDTIGNAQKYIWNFGDGTGNVSTTSTTTSHTFTKIGTYQVRLVAVDSTTCNLTDTSYITIRVKDNPATLSYSYKKELPCDSFKYVFYSNSVPSPASAADSAFTWNFGDGTITKTGLDSVQHNYAAAGTYTVLLTLTDTLFCNAPLTDSFRLSVASLVKAVFTTPASGCAPYTAQFSNASSAGQQFYWSFGDGSTSALTNPTHLYTTPGSYTVELVAVDSSTCNIVDSASTTVIVYSLPVAGFNFSPQPAVENTPVTLTNTSTGATNYKWDFGDGTTLVTTQDTAVTHQYVKTGTYNVCLTAYNADGCADTVCQEVPAIIVPLVDVPNALTANGDGLNDLIYVRGFGITKMDWKIYSRWGTIIFESTDPSIGWDGKYKGTIQPQDVYVYVLNVVFGDGTKYQKKGDITLLR